MPNAKNYSVTNVKKKKKKKKKNDKCKIKTNYKSKNQYLEECYLKRLGGGSKIFG